MTSVSIANSTVSILNPDGSSLASAFVGTMGAFIDVRTLAALAGTGFASLRRGPTPAT